jgi:hypothetical protein
MKKYLAFSVAAATLLMAGGDVKPVAPVVAAATDMGTVFGQARTFYIDRTYNSGTTINRNSLNVGGYIGYTTPAFSGLKFTTAVYGTYGFDIHSNGADVTNTNYDPSLYGRDGENYAFIGQAYLDYTNGKTNVKVGRQKLDTPMAGSDDARMLPNLFEAAVLVNTDLENTTLIAAHVTKMTAGTFSNIYDDSANSSASTFNDLGMYSGYGRGTTLAQSGDFADMGVVALGSGVDTNGVTAVAAIHTYDNGLVLQAWDYYAYDIVNVVYAQADMPWTCMLNSDVKMLGSLQYINEKDIGDSLGGDISSDYYGAQLSATLGNFNAKAAYSTSDNGTLSPWGGSPAFTQGMVTRHQFMPNTDAWKVSGTYNFTELNLNATVYYASFDIGTVQSGYITNDTTTESGFDLIYQATKDLQYRFRGNFPNDFKTGLDWNEYRFIVNYNF